MYFSRNNLDKAVSPYLQQHKDNPIFWQEWNRGTLNVAQKEHKPLFVSVGYATCHWCHVMATEAFQDPVVASYLNNNFISIKVDREQRPDIDSYLMSFTTAMGGQGGWPLNCFLSPDLKPIFAITYAPARSFYGQTGLLDILPQVKDYYDREHINIEPFEPQVVYSGEELEDELVDNLWDSFDHKSAGFGSGIKFPPHCTLLLMLYSYPSLGVDKIAEMIEKTLDAIALRGLHDHLQGGFFRYCVDSAWTIPHFEKMLYDQAMQLWVYSLAYKMFGKPVYRDVVTKLLGCLKDTFEDDGLYYSGHDADTDHKEGATYLWKVARIKEILTAEEYREFSKIYDVTSVGNFEGKNHLIRKHAVPLPDIELKLLQERRNFNQPLVDKKIITSWNCLAGVGLIHAYRLTGHTDALAKAELLLKNLLARHYVQGSLAHSSCDGKLQAGKFLQDYASLLLFLTYLYEENVFWGDRMKSFYDQVLTFKKENVWLESWNDDFMPVVAGEVDQPIPSSVALAEFALLRADVLLGRDFSSRQFKATLYGDFMNVAVLLSNGLFHIIEAPAKVDWNELPINSLQRMGANRVDCYQGVCHEMVSNRH